MTSIGINGTLYGTQSAASFAQWRAGAPARSVFAVKAAPDTTRAHTHALTGAGPSIERFMANVSALGHGRCPILGQFPRTKKFDPAQRVPWLDQLPAALDGLALPRGIKARDSTCVARCRARAAGGTVDGLSLIGPAASAPPRGGCMDCFGGDKVRAPNSTRALLRRPA